tara:strand:- start:7164 stop:7850 length:687 start_codon:yes stop_codon:yes gene_type:complete
MFLKDTESIPAACWETLGQYVYGYKEDGKWVYIGKGNKNRAQSHVGDKGYDIKDLYIIARNLERFNKRDYQSFLLESFLITNESPRDNSVSGHYKECFIMAKMSELFNEFEKSQHDNFESQPDWYVENYNIFKGRLNVYVVKSHHHLLEFETTHKMQPVLEITTDDDVQLKIMIHAKDDVLETRKEQLYTFCEEFGITDIEEVGVRNHFNIGVENKEMAFKFIEDFYS